MLNNLSHRVGRVGNLGPTPGDCDFGRMPFGEDRMDKKIAGLLGAMAAFGTLNGAEAAPAPTPDPSEALKVNSYAELLEPIPDAVKVLRAIEEQSPVQPWGDNIKVAPWD